MPSLSTFRQCVRMQHNHALRLRRLANAPSQDRVATPKPTEPCAASYFTSNRVAEVNGGRGKVVGGRPAGCPRSFCGCGASIRVFGRIVPGLNLASNWLRFPRTAPAPGMVAARRGHVFVLEQHVQGDTWIAYEQLRRPRNENSHALFARYAVVNPRAA